MTRLCIRFAILCALGGAFFSPGSGHAAGAPSLAATAAAIRSGVPLHTLLAEGNPNITVRQVSLPAAAACAGAHCFMLHYSFHAGHLAAPVGASVGNSGLCCGYWYYTNSDELADWTGHVWSATEWEDGDANSRNVYMWHNQCTPAGTGVAINDCFTNFNGGGYPYNGLQYGMDICTGITTGWVSFCTHHGQRRWIDDWGSPSTYYDW